MPTCNMTLQDQQRLHRGAAHLHRLGPRALSEMLATLAARIGGGPALLAILAEFERLSPGQVRAATGSHSSHPRVREQISAECDLSDEDTDQAGRMRRNRPPSE